MPKENCDLLISIMQLKGRCQMAAKQAMSKRASMQIKGITMATSHGSPSSGTCHTEFSVENKCTYLDKGRIMNQEAGRRGKAKGKNSKVTQSNVTRAKLHSGDTTTHARGDHPLANSRSPS